MDCQASLVFSAGTCTAEQCSAKTIQNTGEGSTTCTGATGATCRYTCANGYRDTGSGSVSCETTNQFSAGDCTATACTQSQIEHTTDGTTTCNGVTGDTCSFTCADGYTDSVSGSVSGSVSCQASGRFSAGECTANSCTQSQIEHTTAGTKTCNGVTGETCSFTCAVGYPDSVSKSMSGSVSCQASGEFSHGGCAAAGCAQKLIEHTTEGTKTCDGVTGDTRSYQCVNGYTDSGGGSVSCQASGRFSAGLCNADPCAQKTIEHTDQGSTSCNGVTEDTCPFTCADGYQSWGLASGGQVDCQWSDANSRVEFSEPWNGSGHDACEPMPCDEKVIEHTTDGTTTCHGSTDGAPCIYSCKEGFTDSSAGPKPSTSTCQPHGKSPTKPAFSDATCAAQPCVDKTIEHTTAAAGSTTCKGSTEDPCTFTCVDGYEDAFADLSETNVQRTIVCYANHSFGVARCERKACLLPNGDSSADSTVDGAGIPHSAPSSTAEWDEASQTKCAPGNGFDSKTDDVCHFFCAQGFGVHGSKDELSGQTTCTAQGAGDPEYDTISCTDIDECATENAGCSGNCHNTDGSFYCGACDNSGPSAWGAESPGCCSGGTRSAWPKYGPTERCCASDASGECAIGTLGGACEGTATTPLPHSWLQDGCIGPPTASNSVVQLFSAVDGALANWANGQWSIAAFGQDISAGTALVIAIDAKDTLGSRDAELSSLCQGNSFAVSSQSLTALPSMIEPLTSGIDATPDFYSDVNISSAGQALASQYYASRMKATVTGTYTVSVQLMSMDDGSALGAVTAGFVTIVPAALDAASCVVTALDGNVLSNQCISGSCKSLPSQQLQFKVKIFDEFGNSRGKLDSESLLIAVGTVESESVGSDPSQLGVSCCGAGCSTCGAGCGANCAVYSDDSESYSLYMISTRDNPQPLHVIFHVGLEILQLFNYTAANLAPDDVNKLLSVRSDRVSRPCSGAASQLVAPSGTTFTVDRCIDAGEPDAFTIVVTDDQCQGKQQCQYTPDPVEACCSPKKRHFYDKNRCTKQCTEDPCGGSKCSCPVYSTTVGCVRSYGLASGASSIHIVAQALVGVLQSTTLPVYDTTASTASPDCSVASGNCFSTTCSSAVGVASGDHPACLGFGFVQTLAGVYQVSLALGSDGKCLGDDGQCLEFPLSGQRQSTWNARVNPTSLDPDQSQPGPLFDFDTSEAGRNTTFYVVPRDQYFNLRDQHSDFELRGGEDTLQLNVSGPQESSPNITVVVQPWNSTQHWFEASQLVTVSGTYMFSVQLSNSEVNFELLSRSIVVIPAMLDVDQTVVELYAAAAGVYGGEYNAVVEGDAHYRYSQETAAGGGCQSASRSSECAEICVNAERCDFYWWAGSDSSCCLVESYDSTAPKVSPPDPTGNVTSQAIKAIALSFFEIDCL